MFDRTLFNEDISIALDLDLESFEEALFIRRWVFPVDGRVACVVAGAVFGRESWVLRCERSTRIGVVVRCVDVPLCVGLCRIIAPLLIPNIDKNSAWLIPIGNKYVCIEWTHEHSVLPWNTVARSSGLMPIPVPPKRCCKSGCIPPTVEVSPDGRYALVPLVRGLS